MTSRFHIYERKPQAVICHNPGKFTLTTTVQKDIPKSSTPLPVPEGTLLRYGSMLGRVVDKRMYTDAGATSQQAAVPLHCQSVLVCCLASIDRFAELDLATEHVWPIQQCQVLEGSLAKHAQKDPVKFLELFCKVERETKPKKKFPPKK